MNIRRSLLGFIIIVAVMIVFVLWFGKKKSAEMPSVASPTTNATLPAVAATSPQSNISVQTNVSPTQVPSVSTSAVISQPSIPPPDKVTVLKEFLQANDADIVFYGRLQDQFGDAVGNAVVNFGIRYENLNGKGVQRGQVTSDANGLFTISGYRGQDINVVPEKGGYVPLEMKGSGNYSPALYPEGQRAHPDPNNPVVVTMWKLQGGESLIHFSFNARVPYDGTPVIFDFHSGKVVNAGGDLIIRLQCPLTPDTREQYDWQATVQPVDGGIIPDNERMELMFQAPDSGYEPEFAIKNEKDIKPWSSTFHGGFYFKSHDGSCYGKFGLGVVIYAIRDGLVPITIDGYLNPAGSRNLEIDPTKVTAAHP